MTEATEEAKEHVDEEAGVVGGPTSDIDKEWNDGEDNSLHEEAWDQSLSVADTLSPDDEDHLNSPLRSVEGEWESRSWLEAFHL